MSKKRSTCKHLSIAGRTWPERSGCYSSQLRTVIDDGSLFLAFSSGCVVLWSPYPRVPALKSFPSTLESRLAHRLSNSDVRNQYTSQTRHFQIGSNVNTLTTTRWFTIISFSLFYARSCHRYLVMMKKTDSVQTAVSVAAGSYAMHGYDRAF
jgi:hypothetical protein